MAVYLTSPVPTLESGRLWTVCPQIFFFLFPVNILMGESINIHVKELKKSDENETNKLNSMTVFVAISLVASSKLVTTQQLYVCCDSPVWVGCTILRTYT